MKRIETRRLNPAVTTGNLKSLAKIKTLKGYKPPQADFTLEELQAAEKEVSEAREEEAQAEQAMKAARNRAVAAEWSLHNKVQGSKKQIVAIYGEDSDEVQAVGLKKRSEWKRPAGRKPKVQTLPKVA